MVFDELKLKVLNGNKQLQALGLITLTWGNLSALSDDGKHIAIKPSGITYDEMVCDDIVVLDLKGNIVEGGRKPSSDTPTHLVLYEHFQDIKSVIHTHSTWATIWSQAGRSIPCMGTTHADYFYGEVPCVRVLNAEEIKTDYERNQGKVIAESIDTTYFKSCPAVLCEGHGPFCWGTSIKKALENAIVLENIAKMAYYSLELKAEAPTISKDLMDKHFYRKHGKNAYYGQ